MPGEIIGFAWSKNKAAIFTARVPWSFFDLSHWARPVHVGHGFPDWSTSLASGGCAPDPHFVDLVRTSERPPFLLKKWAQKIPESLQLFVWCVVMCADRCYAAKGVDWWSFRRFSLFFEELRQKQNFDFLRLFAQCWSVPVAEIKKRSWHTGCDLSHWSIWKANPGFKVLRAQLGGKGALLEAPKRWNHGWEKCEVKIDQISKLIIDFCRF